MERIVECGVLPVVRAAGDLLREMATFDSAGVSDREDVPAPDETWR